MPITVEINLALPYWADSEDFVYGPLTNDSGRYIISLDTLEKQWPLVLESLSQGSIIAVESTVESVATLWYVVRNSNYEPWIKKQRLKFITGGTCEKSIANFNTEYFISATVASQLDLQEIFDLTFADDRPYTFLFTNRKTRPHRRYLISSLAKQGLLDRAIWSCRDPSDCWSHPEFNRVYCEDVLYQKILPPGYDPDVPPAWIDGVIYPKQYQDSWFSVVSETVFEYPYSFRTEKTYRTILAGHPFIICANHGFYRDLRNLGFKTFHGLIDEKFDDIEDGKKRLDHLIGEISWLCQQDLVAFWKETAATRLYNQQHMLEIHNSLKQDFMPRLHEFINA